MSSSSSSSTVNVLPSASTLLGVAFVVLKLTGHISWPWLWVTAPFWIPLAIVLGILAFGAALLGIAFIIKVVADKE